MIPRVQQPMNNGMQGERCDCSVMTCSRVMHRFMQLQCLYVKFPSKSAACWACNMLGVCSPHHKLCVCMFAGMGPQGYAWPTPNMMPANMQTDPSFRPSVAMDPSMIPPYYNTGVPQSQQWQPQSLPGQGLSQAQPHSDQVTSQQMSSVQQQ